MASMKTRSSRSFHLHGLDENKVFARLNSLSDGNNDIYYSAGHRSLNADVAYSACRSCGLCGRRCRGCCGCGSSCSGSSAFAELLNLYIISCAVYSDSES